MENQMPQNNPPKKSKGKKIFIIGSAVVVLVGGFFVWQYFNRKRNNEEDTATDQRYIPLVPDVSPTVKPSSYKAPVTKEPVAVFPLKKGSKGDKVKELQNALMAKYGAAALPKYGADGDFGTETIDSLKKNGWPELVDENVFNVIVSSADPVKSAAPIDAKGIAKKLLDAGTAKNFSVALSTLKTIRNTKDYEDISYYYKMLSFPQYNTLVDGILKAFTEASQKDQVKQQFIRMGLKNNGDKWSLSGALNSKMIITLHDTFVWDYPNKRIAVEGNTILGTAIETRGGYTLFRTLDNLHQLLVKSTSIIDYEKH